ncbi:hypothetical protein RJ639_018364, partial [Escallonia herrerae]
MKNDQNCVVSETYAKEIEMLKEKVRTTISAAAGSNPVEKMCLIDAIQRLGVASHFEQEIDAQLEQIFAGESTDTDYDLYTVALHFRLCRQLVMIFPAIWEVVEDGYQEQEQASLSGNQLKQYKEIIKKDANCPKKNENEVNFSESKDGEQVFYTCSNAQEDEGVWYVDSGCSNHMTGIKENFISLDERFKSKVKLGNGKFVKVEGKGEIVVRTKKSNSKFIKDLIHKGYKLNFDENCCMIVDKKNDQVIATIKMAPNKVFPLSMEHKEDLSFNAAENMDESMSPTKAVNNATPYEAWFKRKPKIDHLKVFGCLAYHLIHSQEREKLDEKGEKCIFMGYSDESKAYRLYKPETNELIVSRDVIFDETKAWNWNKNMTQVQPIFEEFGSVRQEGQGHEVPLDA